MAVKRSSGVTVSTSGPVVVTAPPRGAKRGVKKRTSNVQTLDSAIIAELMRQDLELVDAVPLAVTPPLRTKRGRAAPAAGAVTVDIPLGRNEEAVILVEDQGEYRWIVDGREIGGVPRRQKRGVRAPAATRQKRFALIVAAPTKPVGAAGGRRKRGWLAEKVTGKLVAYVFRFAIKLAGKQLVKFLERKTSHGLMSITSPNLVDWRLLDDDAPLPQRLPVDRSPKVLLLVHGTFSSTVGSFGAMTVTNEGRAFLAGALAQYDAVLGYDHRTLSVDPRENAAEMVARLKSLRCAHPPEYDIVAFSRGGLVARSALEQLLPDPKTKWRATIGRVVFVGCTNGGTQLANPENWHGFADHYTNLALGAVRAISLIPGAQGWTAIAGQCISGMGTFVKALATGVITDNVMPGLAAMQPDGKFVGEINETSDGQISAADARFYAITTNFDASAAAARASAPELPRKYLLRMLDWLADTVYGEPNDLVVHVRSMTQIDPQAGEFVKDKMEFGENSTVYHTNYFAQPETATQLAEWFETTDAAAPVVRVKRRAKLSSGAKIGRKAVQPVRRPVSAEMRTHNRNLERAAARVAKLLTSTSTAVIEPELTLGPRGPGPGPGWHAEGVASRRPSRKKKAKKKGMKRGGGASDGILGIGRGSSGPSISFRQIGRGPIGPGVRPVPGAADSGGGYGSGSGAAIDYSAPPKRSAKRKAAARRPMQRARPPAAREPTPGATGRSAAAMATPTVSKPRAECHFLAEMPPQVAVKKTAKLGVTISREQVEAAARTAIARGRSDDVVEDEKLTVEVATHKYVRIRGGYRTQVDVPEPGHPVTVPFTVEGDAEGTGEISVHIRQGSRDLVSLWLFPQVVKVASPGPSLRAEDRADRLPPGRPLLDELRIIEYYNGAGVSYKFWLSLPSLGIHEDYDTPLMNGERDAYAIRVMNDLGDSWIRNGQDGIKNFEKDLRSIGAQMFRELLPQKLQELLWKRRKDIKNVQVFSLEPFIPWELIYLMDPANDEAQPDNMFLGELGLLRWSLSGFPAEKLRIRRERARYLIADYPDPNFELPLAEDEEKMLKKVLSATAITPKLKNLYDLLETKDAFDLLHVCCHGLAASAENSQARIYINGVGDAGGDLDGEVLQATTVQTSIRLVAEGAENRPIVVLNACESARPNREFHGMGGFAHAFIKARVGAFVGTHWSVGDSPAFDFVKALYEEFAKPRDKPVTLGEAVTAARRSARDKDDATWLAYVVYGHPHAEVTVE
jgi:hypothetical protein